MVCRGLAAAIAFRVASEMVGPVRTSTISAAVGMNFAAAGDLPPTLPFTPGLGSTTDFIVAVDLVDAATFGASVDLATVEGFTDVGTGIRGGIFGRRDEVLAETSRTSDAEPVADFSAPALALLGFAALGFEWCCFVSETLRFETRAEESFGIDERG